MFDPIFFRTGTLIQNKNDNIQAYFILCGSLDSYNSAGNPSVFERQAISMVHLQEICIFVCFLFTAIFFRNDIIAPVLSQIFCLFPINCIYRGFTVRFLADELCGIFQMCLLDNLCRLLFSCNKATKISQLHCEARLTARQVFITAKQVGIYNSQIKLHIPLKKAIM